MDWMIDENTASCAAQFARLRVELSWTTPSGSLYRATIEDQAGFTVADDFVSMEAAQAWCESEYGRLCAGMFGP